MFGEDSGAAHRRRVVQTSGLPCKLAEPKNIVALPKGQDEHARPSLSGADTPNNPAELLRAAAKAIAIMATPDVPAVWCLATYAAHVERLGADASEALVVALREECQSMRIDLSAPPHASDDIGQRTHHLASSSGLLGFERLTRQCVAFQADLEGNAATWRAYFDRALAVAINAIDAHFALAAA